MFELLRAAGGHRCLILTDEPSGLNAIIAIDSLALGPAAGGVRTLSYASEAAAIADAVQLARAMTLKCALAGLSAGGAKTVILADEIINRAAAFRLLGEYIQELQGVYHCAGDMGTTAADLSAIAERTDYVITDCDASAEAAGRGVMRCIEACAQTVGHEGVRGLRILVQGCGAMGRGVARALIRGGADVLVTDLQPDRAASVADAYGADFIPADDWLTADVDVISPCAAGGVIDADAARQMRAWAVCGAANNQLVDTAAGDTLAERGILFVPDFLSSAGAVIQGFGTSVMRLTDPNRLIDQLGSTAAWILESARASGTSPTAIAEQLADERIRKANTYAV